MADHRAARLTCPPPPSPTSACPPSPRRGTDRRRHHQPLPDPDRDPARLAGRPRRPRPGPHRLRQDLRVRAADARPPRGRPGKRRPGRPRALVLAPTRELASQIEAAMAPLAKAMGLRTLTIFGGVGARTRRSRACATASTSSSPAPAGSPTTCSPGTCDLGSIEITVLDEADHMADLGFLPVVRRLLDTHAEAGPADAVLGHPRRRRRRPGQALPARPGHAQRRLGAVAGLRR